MLKFAGELPTSVRKRVERRPPTSLRTLTEQRTPVVAHIRFPPIVEGKALGKRQHSEIDEIFKRAEAGGLASKDINRLKKLAFASMGFEDSRIADFLVEQAIKPANVQLFNSSSTLSVTSIFPTTFPGLLRK